MSIGLSNKKTVVLRISKRNFDIIVNAGNAADSLNDALTRILDRFTVLTQEKYEE